MKIFFKEKQILREKCEKKCIWNEKFFPGWLYPPTRRSFERKEDCINHCLDVGLEE